jgi:CheY-like chemotaxis protein
LDKKAKIMLIDDDADFIESTKMVLEKHSYEVLMANNGDEGLRKVKQNKPDLILLDIIMPATDGFAVAKKLKEDPGLSGIPVIMLTSFSSKGVGTSIPRGKGYELDAEDYLEKPVTPENLLAAVKKHLKQ